MKIKDICDLQNGRAFKPSDWGTAGLPIIRIQNLNDERAPFNYYDGKYNLAQEVDNGDLLFSWSGTPGTSFGAFLWNRGKGVLNQHIFKVIPKVEVDKTYLMYALNGNISTIISKAHGGVGLQHITKKELDEIEIQVVSISRQKKIVEILEKISLLIFLRKQQLAKLDEVVKARFVEMFGESEYPCNSLISLIIEGAGLSYGIVQPGDDGTGDMGVLRPVDFADGKIKTDSIKYIDRSLGDGFKKTELNGNELLITVRGTTGITALTDSRFKGMNVTRGIAVIRYDKKKVDPIYLNEYIKMEKSQQYIKEHTRGATLQQINLSELRDLEIVIPPLPLQRVFATFVERVDQQKQTVQQSLEKLELMKKALMQEYFG